MKIRSKLTLAIAAAACTAVPTSFSFAQDNGASSLALEEIVVSARKRDESLQDIPIAVDVFTEAKLEQLSIDNVDTLSRYTPSLTYDQGVLPQDTRPVIRGAAAQRGRPNVGILVDYVDVSSEALTVAGGGVTTNLKLLDLERVEIIKGPQNALYGRSAFTGAINYVSKRPSDTFEGFVSADWNEHDAQEIAGAVSGPLIDDVLNARLSFVMADDPGVYRNPNSGQLLGWHESLGAALSLDWQLTDSINSFIRIERSQDEYGQRAEAFIRSMDPNFDPALNPFGTGTVTDHAVSFPFQFPPGGIACNGIDRQQPYFDLFGAGPPCRPLVVGEQHATVNDIDISLDPRTGRDFLGSDLENTRVHFDVTVDFDDIEFKYILGYADSQAFVQEDFDKSSVPIVSVPFGPFPFSQYGLQAMSQQDIDTSQWNHELRLVGTGERLNWMLSLLHWREKMDAQFDDEWWLREGGNAGLVLSGLFNAQPFGPFSYLARPVGPFPDFCALMYPGVPGCVPAVTSLATSPGNTPFIPLQRETAHTSIAAMVSIDITDSFVVSLEGRLLDEKIDYAGGAADVSFYSQFGLDPWWGFMFGPGELTQNTVDEDAFVPKVTLDWSPTDNFKMYGYYSQAFKPGGISTTDANGDVTTGEYKSEELEAFEVGFKSDFRDNSIRLNGALFYYDYTDQQVPYQFTSPTTGLLQTTITNAGETEITGAEVDLTWNSAFLDGISVNLSYTFTDAEFTSFNLAQILAEVGGTPTTFSIVKAGNADADFTGNTPPLTPENSATVSLRYDGNFDSGMATFLEVYAVYNSERFIGEGNHSWLPQYTEVDLFAGLSKDDWELMLYVTNLADSDKIKSGLGNVDYGNLPGGRAVTNAVSLYLPQPRTAGLSFRYNFGDY